MIKACIFDLDGTLADTVESIAYSANCALEFFGLPAQSVSDYKKYAGDGADELLKRCLQAAGDTKLQYYEQMKEKYKELFRERCMYHVIPYEGILQMLEVLKEHQLKLGVLSNKPHDRAVEVVEELFGKNFFDAVMGQSLEIERKPSPMGALMLAEKFGVPAEECLYVGDTDTDMKTGKSAGMFTVGVEWGFRTRAELEENHADAVIKTPQEIMGFLTQKTEASND